jgi:hypothetical protein
MSTPSVQLTASFIGKGSKLFHVSIKHFAWDSATMWLVAADSFKEAQETAIQQHIAEGYTAQDFDSVEDRDGYEIGVIL